MSMNGAENGRVGRYLFLDGLRAIVCFLVFLGHFFVDFCIEDLFPLQSAPYRIGMLLLYGCYTVPLFCAISGFLAVQKEPERGWDLVLAAANRFLRFELPLFFLMAAIMFLNRRGLFAYGDLLAQKLANKQLMGNYRFDSHYTWLFRKPFWDLYLYDNPLWMIGPLFAGNLILYGFCYLCTLCRRYLPPARALAVRLLVLSALLVLSRHDIPLLATLLGGCYGLFRQKAARKSGGGADSLHLAKPLAAAALLLAALSLLVNASLYFLKDFDFERFPRSYEFAGLLAALGILHLVFSSSFLQRVLGRNTLASLSGLSFAVYVIHYPLIGLLACPLLYSLHSRMSYPPLVVLTLLASVAACIPLAFAYNRLLERPCYALIRRLIVFLREN